MPTPITYRTADIADFLKAIGTTIDHFILACPDGTGPHTGILAFVEYADEYITSRGADRLTLHERSKELAAWQVDGFRVAISDSYLLWEPTEVTVNHGKYSPEFHVVKGHATV